MSERVILKLSVPAAREYLYSGKCACGRRKFYGRATCSWCYDELPKLLQDDLRLGIQDGYFEALENALEFLELPLPGVGTPTKESRNAEVAEAAESAEKSC